MAPPPTRALGRVISLARPDSATNQFVDLYSDDGLQLRISNDTEKRWVFSDQGLLRGLVDNFSYPVVIDLNVPFSVGAPTGESLSPNAQMALYIQINGLNTFDRCQFSNSSFQIGSSWDVQQRCLFTRFFNVRDAANATTPLASIVLNRMLRPNALDTVSLFPDPYLASFGFKETRRFWSEEGKETEEQKWYAFQGCTNCLAAGIFFFCNHAMMAMKYKADSNPIYGTEVVPVGYESRSDEQYSGLADVFVHRILAEDQTPLQDNPFRG